LEEVVAVHEVFAVGVCGQYLQAEQQKSLIFKAWIILLHKVIQFISNFWCLFLAFITRQLIYAFIYENLHK